MPWPSALDLVIFATFLTPKGWLVCVRCLAYFSLSSPLGWHLKISLLPSFSSWQCCSLAGDVAQEQSWPEVCPLSHPRAHGHPHTSAGSPRRLFLVGDSGYVAWRVSWLSLSSVTSTLQPAPTVVGTGGPGPRVGHVTITQAQCSWAGIRMPRESNWWHSPWVTRRHHPLARGRCWLSEGPILRVRHADKILPPH